jgi:alpha-amylase
MHKKMLYLSENIHKKTSYKKDKKILCHLWKSQCNCGYWHGLFGGFYFGNIRAAIYENLIKAEKELDKKYEKNVLIVQKTDFNFDGSPEIIVKNKHIISSFSDKGGTLLELGYKDKNFNLLNTITRQEESHHDKNKERKEDKRIKREEIIYDKYERVSLIDHLLEKSLTVNDFNKQKNFKTISNNVYKSSFDRKEKSVSLSYKYKGKDLEFTKKINIALNAGMNVKYIFQNDDIFKKYNFATEFNIFFQSPRDVKFYSEKGEINLKRKRVFRKINNLKISDYFKGIYLQFDFSEADVFIMPIYSFANSQFGLEKVCQQASVLFIKKSKGKIFDLKLKIDKKENLL